MTNETATSVNLDDLITYENEHTALDFKSIQYTKKMYDALLKDILALANADVKGDRRIIIGVKHQSDGSRETLGISEKFIDQATYQQLVHENIEPELRVEYFGHTHEGILIGVLQIGGCDDQPYMMKKKFGNLEKGDSFVRKGSHQVRMTRADIDRIFESKLSDQSFSGDIAVSFSPDYGDMIALTVLDNEEVPSKKAARKIQQILERKRKQPTEKTLQPNPAQQASVIDPAVFAKIRRSISGSLPYEERTIEELEEAFENVSRSYRKNDLHFLYEAGAHKVNLLLLNNGDRYVEDASVRIEIKKDEGICVADKVYSEPLPTDTLQSLSILSKRVNVPSLRQYPKVEQDDGYFIIRENIGDLRHRIPTDAFQEPLRIAFAPFLVGKTVELRCQIYGKNLREPLTRTLAIKVVD